MRITEIKYEHKVTSKQYESETLGATAIVFEQEDIGKAITELKETVNWGLGQFAVAVELPLPKVETAAVTKNVETKEEAKEAVETTKEVTKEPKTKVTKKRAPRKKVEKKPKHVIYDRDIESHKKELGIFLNETYPEWESDLPKAAALSVAIHRQVPLYDEQGKVMQEFKDAVKKGME